MVKGGPFFMATRCGFTHAAFLSLCLISQAVPPAFAESPTAEQRQLATRIANEIVTRMLFSELKASRPCALERFASYDESLYLKLARVIEDKYQPRLGSDYPDIIAMKGKVDLLGSIAGITLVVKSEGFDVNGFAQQLVAAHVERLKTLSVDAEQKKIDDDELKYNAGIDAKRVKAIVEIAADLQKDAISEKERDTLKILRDTLFNELLKDPKRLSSLVVTFPSAEVTTSRQRVQEAIADAQPKKK